MINKKECENLLEIQSGIQSEIEFLEELSEEINKITDNPKNYTQNDFSQYLKNILESKSNKYQSFIRELTQLSKDYGVVIKSIGGVQIGEMKNIEYSDDETSGDLIPTVDWV
ncbi:MAG TPA: hypothetical protein P5556_01700 [Candidatus Gastranaerophilales bacterium]|nr:hypothetical protein [Candidatus Gastranaerophilales bacterium]